MQTAATSPDVQTSPPPAEAKPANGAGNPEHLSALPATELLHQNEEITRKLASIETLGRQVIAKGGEVSKQETKCAEIKANLDSERDRPHKLERERDELQEELTMLATGKQSERLPFPPPTEGTKPAAANAAADADAWKSVTLESLGIKMKRVLAALHDHQPPIVTHGDLAAWQEKKADFWAKDIKGLGAKGREEIENAQAAYWQANPQPAKAEAAKSGEPFDDAEILPITESVLINKTRKLTIFDIRVAQRRSGRWAAKFVCSIAGAKSEPGKATTHDKYEGNYPSRIEATVSAVDACDTFVRALLNSKPSKKIREAATEVRRIIDKLDKELAAESPEAARVVAEGLPDPKAQAEADMKNTEQDNAAKRGRKGK